MAENFYYLTTAMKDGVMIAVISLGSPQKGDKDITVCSVTSVKDVYEARQWFARMMLEKPWEVRQ